MNNIAQTRMINTIIGAMNDENQKTQYDLKEHVQRRAADRVRVGGGAPGRDASAKSGRLRRCRAVRALRGFPTLIGSSGATPHVAQQ